MGGVYRLPFDLRSAPADEHRHRPARRVPGADGRYRPGVWLLARRSGAASRRRRDPGAGGSSLRRTLGGRPGGRRAGGRLELEVGAARLRRLDHRHAGGAAAASRTTRVPVEADRGRDGAGYDRPLRARRRAAAIPAAGAVRAEQPRHRPRRALVLRQTGRGPQLGGNRLPVGHPASPRHHESGAGGRAPRGPSNAVAARWTACMRRA